MDHLQQFAVRLPHLLDASEFLTYSFDARHYRHPGRQHDLLAGPCLPRLQLGTLELDLEFVEGSPLLLPELLREGIVLEVLLVLSEGVGLRDDEGVVGESLESGPELDECSVEFVEVVVLVADLPDVLLDLLLVGHLVDDDFLQLLLEFRRFQRQLLVGQPRLLRVFVQEELVGDVGFLEDVVSLQGEVVVWVGGGGTFDQADGEGVAVGLLQFDEAVEEEEGELGGEAERDAQPEGPDVGLGVGEDDAHARHQQHHQQQVPHSN